MGYIKDEHMIFRCWERNPLEKLRDNMLGWIEEAFDDDELPDFSNYLSPVMRNLANPDYYLFMPADGSKEGWETSNNMDEVREKIWEYIIRHNSRNKDKISCIVVTDDEYKGLSAGRLFDE